jgi:prepilin-type N-terminal cleavage/methylation domain-containing protein
MQMKRIKAAPFQAGFTALEISIALAVLAIISLAIERTITVTRDAERDLKGTRVVLERGQRLGYEIRRVVSASRKLFQNDAAGQSYIEALDLDGISEPIPTTRLPVFDEANGLGPDAVGDPRTGNALLFVSEADPAPAVADPATGKLRYIDAYRFVFVYITETNRYLVEETPRRKSRDLIVWRSIAYPSHMQIESISSPTERANVVQDLCARFGYEFAWDPAGGSADGSFHALSPSGAVEATPSPEFLIERDVHLIERGKLVYANLQLARTDASSYPRRSLLTMDDPATWVPDGFEVKIAGTSGSRKVWMHLVIETQSSKGRLASHVSTMIANTKDL